MHSKAAELAVFAEITALPLHNTLSTVDKVEAKELEKPFLFNG